MITIHDPILHAEKGSGQFRRPSEFSIMVDIDDIRDALSLAMALRGLVMFYFNIQLPIHAILKFIDNMPLFVLRQEQDRKVIKIICRSMLIGADLNWELSEERAHGTTIRQVTAINCDVRMTATVRNGKDLVFLSELANAFLPLCFKLWLDESAVLLGMLNTAEIGSEVTLILTIRRGRLVYILFRPGNPEFVHTVPFLEADPEFMAF